MNYIERNFSSWVPVLHKYNNDRIAIEYVSTNPETEGESECVATVNLPEVDMNDDEVAIKNYSENEGIYECMLAAGHISEAIRWEETGWVMVPICKCLIEK